jgi:hypothetical protein
MWIWVLVAGAGGLALGFAVGRLGMWVRISHIESRLRAMKIDARVAQDMGEPLPPEWVADQIEWVLENELRV